MIIKTQEIDINIKIDLTGVPGGSSHQVSIGSSVEKITTNLSVSQIAYLFRLLYDQEIILAQNKSDLLSRVANSLVTKNAPEISIKSLKAKFYTTDSSTKESVKKLLEQLIRDIDS
tara:strand:- start:122 stop:469 length:348 start_codon:yes stop_codon:yes gene_type:complete